MIRSIWTALFLLLIGISPSLAASEGFVVSSCPGTLGVNAYTAGQFGAITVDVNGIQCTSGSGGGGGLSVTDQAAWTQGTSAFTPSGGVFNDTATLTSGQQGTFRLTTKRGQIVDVDTTGNQLHSDLTASIPAGTNAIGSVKILDTAGTNLATVKPASTAPVATDTSVVIALNPNSPGIIATAGATTANSVPTNLNSQYPVNSVTTTPTPLVAKGTGSTGAVTGTLTPASTATAYVCGFNVSYVGGTAQIGPLVLSGLLGGSFTYQIPVSATAPQNFTQTFTPCIPASAVNTPIVMTTVADGTASAVDVNIWGYGL